MPHRHAATSGSRKRGTPKNAFGTPHSPRCRDEGARGTATPQLPCPMYDIMTGSLRMRSRARTGKSLNGLPVLSSEKFYTLSHAPIGKKRGKIFDFQGYEEREGGHVVYKDVLAANGLRDGSALSLIGKGIGMGWELRGPSDVHEYEIGIISKGECVEVFSLSIEPRTGGRGREIAKEIFLALVSYVQRGDPLDKARDFVDAFELSLLASNTSPCTRPAPTATRSA